MKTLKTTRRWTRRVGIAALVLLVIALAVPVAQAADNKPNVVIIRGDDIGWANILTFHPSQEDHYEMGTR